MLVHLKRPPTFIITKFIEPCHEMQFYFTGVSSFERPPTFIITSSLRPNCAWFALHRVRKPIYHMIEHLMIQHVSMRLIYIGSSLWFGNKCRLQLAAAWKRTKSNFVKYLDVILRPHSLKVIFVNIMSVISEKALIVYALLVYSSTSYFQHYLPPDCPSAVCMR